MRRIRTAEDIEEGLLALAAADTRLVPVIAGAGPVPLRLSEPGFASLASIVISQQVSIASARAIRGRLAELVDPLDPSNFLHAGETVWRQAGLSAPKQRTLVAISRANLDEGLDLGELCDIDSEEAKLRLTAVKGIGPWTAEIYLLFCAGHADILPAGDLALQLAAAHALALKERPDHRELSRIAEVWAPWRGVAARLLWAHYAAIKGREAVPAASAIAKDQ